MPHYFFDLTDNKTVHDFKGKQLANIQLARQHAIGIARELIKTKSTLLSEPISAWSVTVKDAKFQKLFSVPITDAMPAWNRLIEQPWRIMSIGLRQWAHGF
jgi:hypothetical protein